MQYRAPIDYQREDFTRVLPDGSDVVFDGIGEEGYRLSFTALKRAACSAPTATRSNGFVRAPKPSALPKNVLFGLLPPNRQRGQGHRGKNDRRHENAEGKVDKAKGTAHNVAGDLKDAARDATNND